MFLKQVFRCVKEVNVTDNLPAHTQKSIYSNVISVGRGIVSTLEGVSFGERKVNAKSLFTLLLVQ